MASVELTHSSFGTQIEKAGITLVDFWAEWCGPCRMFGPIFEAASEKYPEITFGKVDTEAEQLLANEAGISSIPTLMVFRDGILLYNNPGALTAEALDEIITAVSALNMDDVLKEVAKQNQQAKQ
jgi:thioredoxin 1